MLITIEQLEQYHQQGFLLLSELFSPVEVNLMKGEIPALFTEQSPRCVLEKDGVTVRSVYGSHHTNPIFADLVRQDRLVAPAQLMLHSAIYVHQFKINAKVAFGGDVWAWHQDYIFWLKEDGMLRPNAVSAVIFLDEVNEFNGPIMFIPGSHNEGVIDVAALEAIPEEYRDSPTWISNLTADLKYTLSKEHIAHLVQENGIVAPKGPAGSVLFFHGNVFHASSVNLSPFDRTVVIVTYNSVNNTPLPVEQPRPEFLSSRDYHPIESLVRLL